MDEQPKTGRATPDSLAASAVEHRRHAKMLADASVRGEQKFNRYVAEKCAAEARYRESLLRW